MKQKTWKRMLSIILSAVMILCLSVGAASATVTQDQINALKSKAETLSSQKAELQGQLDQLATSKNSALEKKRILEQKINVLREEITNAEAAIAEYNNLIAEKEVELQKAKEEEDKYNQLFLERVRSMEEDGKISYLAVIFKADSFSDMLDQLNRVSEIMDYDKRIIEELEAARQAVQDAKTSLEESKTAQEQVRNNLSAQKADLVAQENQVEAAIAEINNNSASYASKLEDVEADSANLSQQITNAESTYAAQLKEQQAKAAAAAAAASSSSGGGKVVNPSGSGGFIWPLAGYTTVSSYYGYRICPFHGRELHSGIDIPAPNGTPIRAAKGGVVIISTYGSSYGNYVVIAHGDGTRTMYAHQSSRAVSAGASVSQGQTIGYVGSTGSSTGNHLHFELWNGSSSSSRVNPLNYF